MVVRFDAVRLSDCLTVQTDSLGQILFGVRFASELLVAVVLLCCCAVVCLRFRDNCVVVEVEVVLVVVVVVLESSLEWSCVGLGEFGFREEEWIWMD